MMMDEACSLPSTIMNLDEDVLAHCASYLKMKDILNLSVTCKYLNRLSYSDSIWLRWFREHWPQMELPSFGVKDAYIHRLTALRKFMFSDPMTVGFHLRGRHVEHVLMDHDDVVLSQGNLVKTMKLGNFDDKEKCCNTLRGHNARITCLRWFSISENGLEKYMVTSSADHCIRLWSKNSSLRCFKGHTGPVLTLSDKLLGDGTSKLFASGGEDATLRIWSLESGGRGGQHALRATLYGHQKPVKFLSVAGHKSSLLVSMSTDSKIRVWDASSPSSVRHSSCVGTSSVTGAPLGIACQGSLLYAASSCSVTAIDLKTMQKAFTCVISPAKISSFKMLPSKHTFCTGGNGKVLLWDARRNHKYEAVAELDGHEGPVKLLHMDEYKVVTVCPEYSTVHIWDGDTGQKLNSFDAVDVDSSAKISALAACGTRMVAAIRDEDDDRTFLRYSNFFDCVSPVTVLDDCPSRFWHSYSTVTDV